MMKMSTRIHQFTARIFRRRGPVTDDVLIAAARHLCHGGVATATAEQLAAAAREAGGQAASAVTTANVADHPGLAAVEDEEEESEDADEGEDVKKVHKNLPEGAEAGKKSEPGDGVLEESDSESADEADESDDDSEGAGIRGARPGAGSERAGAELLQVVERMLRENRALRVLYEEEAMTGQLAAQTMWPTDNCELDQQHISLNL